MKTALRFLLCIALCALSRTVTAQTPMPVEQWREQLAIVRQLAENDANLAYQEANTLQADMPADASPSDRVRLLNLLSRIETTLAETDAAMAHARQAFDLAEQSGDKAGQAEADLNIAANAVNRAKIDELIAADSHALTVLEGVERPDLLAESMFRVSMMYIRMEKLEEAVAMAVQAMELAKRSRNDLVLAYAYQGMAVVYDQNGRNREAREYYLKMLEHAKAAGSKLLEANALLGIGTAIHDRNEARSGENSIREAIALYRQIGGPFYLAHALFSLADNLLKQGHYSQTISILTELVTIYEQRNNKIGLWWTLFQRSNNYQLLGEIKQATTDAERSYRLAKEIGFPVYLNKSARRLAEIAASTGDYQQAYRLTIEADETAAKFASQKAGERMIELAQRYQAESRQREIDQLNLRNQQQANELKTQSLHHRWLLTVLGGSILMLAALAAFVARLRLSQRRLTVLNAQVSQSKNSLQATLDTIPDQLFELGLDGCFYAYHSPRGSPLTSDSDPVGKRIVEIMPAAAAASILSALDEAHVQGVSFGRQYELSLPHGRFWFELSVAAKPGGEEEPRFVVLSRDITERKNYETMLLQQAELERRQSQFFKIAPGFFFTAVKQAGGHYRLLFASSGLSELYGLTPAQVTDDAALLWNMAHPIDLEQIFRSAETEMGSPTPVCAEYRIRHPEKGERWIETRALPQRLTDNNLHWYGFMLDITERKQAENELNTYKDQLEFTVQQRTAELRLACDAAEAANKAKSVFLANMSHELRTPLNAILGFSSLLRKNPLLPEEERRTIEIIHKSGEHLLNLINDVLEMAKIEAGRLQLEDAPFDLGAMVSDVTEMMQVRARDKNLQLKVDQTSEFPRYIVGDEARLRQILINLVGNALKFTQQGGVTIRLGTKNNAYSHLLIEVEDTGPGIAPEDQKSIFEPFVQLQQPTDSKGTGLGLTITRQFIQLMNGHIDLESKPGKGALFRIDLPLRPAAATDIDSLHRTEDRKIVGVMPGQTDHRILIVEDQLENQLLLTHLMEPLGFQIKLADNGKQGVALFQNWHPDFIWMDRRMPVMDGLEATKLIRTLPGGKDVKIVAVTASAFTEQRQELLNAGMDDFVRKPYRIEEIYDCLARLLNIQYLYADTPPLPQSDALTPAMFVNVPEALRGELEAALESLESEAIERAIRKIGEHAPNSQAALSRFADNFDYPTILEALRGPYPPVPEASTADRP